MEEEDRALELLLVEESINQSIKRRSQFFSEESRKTEKKIFFTAKRVLVELEPRSLPPSTPNTLVSPPINEGAR